MENETKTKNVWALVLTDGNYQLLHHTEQGEHLEDVLKLAREHWQEVYTSKGLQTIPHLSMHNKLAVNIRPFELIAQVQGDQSQIIATSVSNYEHLAYLLADHLKSEEGQAMREQGWICQKKKTKITNPII